MQFRFKDGSVIASGGCSKDAELDYVGEKNTPLCKVGIAVGETIEEGTGNKKTIWANVVAWRGLAEVLSTAKKGDPVFVIGKLKTREYDGKTYTDLIAEWIGISKPAPAAPTNTQASSVGGFGGFSELSDDEGDLPF